MNGPFKDGTIAVDLDPLSLLCRLAASVPPSKMHTVRFAGVLSAAHRFRSLVELYWEAGRSAGHPQGRLKVGVHSLGYVAATTQEAADDFFPGYARAFTDIGRERGWRPVTRADFDAQRGPLGALLVGSPDEVVEKILRHSEALGGVSRFTFQMNAASLPHPKLMQAIELLGTRVVPALRKESAVGPAGRKSQEPSRA